MARAPDTFGDWCGHPEPGVIVGHLCARGRGRSDQVVRCACGREYFTSQREAIEDKLAEERRNGQEALFGGDMLAPDPPGTISERRGEWP